MTQVGAFAKPLRLRRSRPRQRPRLVDDRPPALLPLSRGAKGLRGIVVGVGHAPAQDARAGTAFTGLDHAELERRLLEIGFVEGAEVEILHEGVIGRDPIAVRLDDMRVALRRREAAAVLVRPVDEMEWLEAAE